MDGGLFGEGEGDCDGGGGFYGLSVFCRGGPGWHCLDDSYGFLFEVGINHPDDFDVSDCSVGFDSELDVDVSFDTHLFWHVGVFEVLGDELVHSFFTSGVLRGVGCCEGEDRDGEGCEGCDDAFHNLLFYVICFRQLDRGMVY